MRRFILSTLLLLAFSAVALAADDSSTNASSISTDDHGDPLLKAMLTELKFSQEKPAQSVRDLAKLEVSLDAWKQMLRTTSDVFRSDPSLEASNALLHFRVLNRYFVNTEGTVTRNGRVVYTYAFSGSTQADD